MNRSTIREEAPFCEDVAEHGGYVYTTNGALSSRIANKRQSDAIFEVVNLHRKRVIDIGCGDGTYTLEIYDRAEPSVLCGIDPAAPAIDVANERRGDRDVEFTCDSAYSIPYPDDSFDVAHLRGVLHHMDRPVDALREAFRVAPTIVVLEPNGFNPVLKLIEKMSKYHREHGEKSVSPPEPRPVGRRARRARHHSRLDRARPLLLPEPGRPGIEARRTRRRVGAVAQVAGMRQLCLRRDPPADRSPDVLDEDSIDAWFPRCAGHRHPGAA